MSTATEHCDLAIIGAGPGGYVAALRAAQLGMRTVLIERAALGGICLNWGCIPTKALLHTADTLRRIAGARSLGIAVGAPQIDMGQVIGRSRQVAQRLNRGVQGLLKKAGVEVRMASARFAPDGNLRLTGADGVRSTLQARDTLIATGASARPLPGLPFDGQMVWSYRDALTATVLPRSLMIIGAGAIGLEFASFYAALGVQVSVVEAQPHVLPGADQDVSAFLARALLADGIRLLTDTRIADVKITPTGVQASLRHGDDLVLLQAERMLVAIGLEGNTTELDLAHTRVALRGSLIEVDTHGATAHPGIHAIGDVTGPPMLAHKAMHEGLAVVERLAGRIAHEGMPAFIPACTYGHPQTASVGPTEAQVRGRGIPLRIGHFPLEGNGKAIAIGEASGFVKTLFDANSGALLGAHIVGPDAPELIHGYTLAMGLESTEAELTATVFPHPTLSESLHESVLAAWDRALHL